MEKIARKDPIQRYQDKLQLQGISVDFASAAIETTSIESPQRGLSPLGKSNPYHAQFLNSSGRKLFRKKLGGSKS